MLQILHLRFRRLLNAVVYEDVLGLFVPELVGQDQREHEDGACTYNRRQATYQRQRLKNVLHLIVLAHHRLAELELADVVEFALATVAAVLKHYAALLFVCEEQAVGI